MSTARIDVGERRARALEDEAVRRRRERERRRDRLVARPEPRDPAEEVQTGRPARDRGSIGSADALGDEALELLDRRAEREPSRAQDAEHELLLALVQQRLRERNVSRDGLGQASAGAGVA
jgi:hypothetical protein